MSLPNKLKISGYHTSFQAFVRHPENDESRQNRDYAHGEAMSALNAMDAILRGSSPFVGCYDYRRGMRGTQSLWLYRESSSKIENPIPRSASWRPERGFLGRNSLRSWPAIFSDYLTFFFRWKSGYVVYVARSTRASDQWAGSVPGESSPRLHFPHLSISLKEFFQNRVYLEPGTYKAHVHRPELEELLERIVSGSAAIADSGNLPYKSTCTELEGLHRHVDFL